MKPRRILPSLERRLVDVPAVVLLEPRQAGKTTLAHTLAARHDPLYLDLESERDRAKLAEPELCLLLHLASDRLWAIEIKRSLKPRPERGFHGACADLAPERRFVVYPGGESFPLGSGVEAIPLPARLLAGARP